MNAPASSRIYMDNHATTPVDPRVVEAMSPTWTEWFGNPGSTSHDFGREARQLVDRARSEIAGLLHAEESEIVFTSGATESNNLALRGVAERLQSRGKHLISARTEHKAVLDPLARLGRRGFEITLLPVASHEALRPGWVEPDRVAAALRPDTILVSVMMANNEIGTIQSLADIGAICRARGVWLHSDATQAVGKIPVDLRELPVDLLSFSGHKIYGPRGIGALFVRRSGPRVRLVPQIEGGGQEFGMRSGTLNVPGIVGLAVALRICLQELAGEIPRLRELRATLWQGIQESLDDVHLNGPPFEPADWRLAGNLNIALGGVDGEALMMNTGDLAVSSGSACTSANPEPSHVLRAIGLTEDATRASLRFGLGRFNSADEVGRAIHLVTQTVRRLRAMS
jgi:cysteine desulfurase